MKKLILLSAVIFLSQVSFAQSADAAQQANAEQYLVSMIKGDAVNVFKSLDAAKDEREIKILTSQRIYMPEPDGRRARPDASEKEDARSATQLIYMIAGGKQNMALELLSSPKYSKYFDVNEEGFVAGKNTRPAQVASWRSHENKPVTAEVFNKLLDLGAMVDSTDLAGLYSDGMNNTQFNMLKAAADKNKLSHDTRNIIKFDLTDKIGVFSAKVKKAKVAIDGFDGRRYTVNNNKSAAATLTALENMYKIIDNEKYTLKDYEYSEAEGKFVQVTK